VTAAEVWTYRGRSHPFLNADGSTDVRALLARWDDEANRDADRSDREPIRRSGQ
jgi:hypothetical protein